MKKISLYVIICNIYNKKKRTNIKGTAIIEMSYVLNPLIKRV